MAILPGTRLGAYEITSAIGAGGMGEVYRARDTRLLRDVAVKVLPAAVAADADRLRRFEQEARATAALNHPNILAVYDVGRDGDVTFVVEELLDGRTLREALGAPIPQRKVIDYAIQIANGLAAAHDKGIVHRDLKPENVIITHGDRVKILDFGLAKTVAPDATQTSTRLAGATEPGVVLGTVGYMAPEQVRGHAVDARADIFSLGAVLYEMLTGRRAFAGDSAADTIGAVLKEAPPDPSDSGRPIPPALARIVWRCLEKNPALRFQSATDLAFALQSLSTDSSTSASHQPAIGARERRTWIVPASALAAGIAIGAVAVGLFRTPPAVTSDPVRFTLSAADGLTVDDLTRAAVSPDGRHVALAEAVAGDRQLTVVSITDGTPKRLGPIGIGMFGWSPDSKWLAYFAVDRSLHKISVDSQQRQRLAALEWSPNSVSWSTSGDIFLAASVSSALTVVPSTGGDPRKIFPIEAGKLPWASVQALGDGRLLLSRGGAEVAEIVLANADGSGTPAVIGSGSLAYFVRPDILTAVRGNQIVAWRTDLRGGALTGEPIVIAHGVLVRNGVANVSFSADPRGLAVYRAEQHELKTRLAWFDRSGREGAALSIAGHCRNPEFSPAFDRLAFECWHETGTRDVWVYDFARDSATRLTTHAADDADPVWTPDGKTVIFASSRRGSVDVFKTMVGGSRSEELLFETPGSTPVMAISPDGTQLMLLATEVAVGSGLDLTTYALDNPARPVTAMNTPAAEIEGQFSPDGKFLAYGSNQTGRFEVYVEPWPQTGERWSISTSGGTDARWSPDGAELFYLTPERRLMSVSLRRTPSFVASRPVELFQTRIAGPLGLGHRFPFAVSKDGKRFLMYVSDPDGPPPAVSAISNWGALLGK